MFLGGDKEYADISGNTLLVYFYLLRKRESCGVREIQKAFGFSSSSSAHYHLEKLTQKGVLSKDTYGNYRVNKDKHIGFINPFLIVHGFILPKQLIYAIVTTLMWLLFLVFSWSFLTTIVMIALLPGLVASAIFWYDATRLWSHIPYPRKNRSTVTQVRSNV
jgi:hypothetical protein